MVVLNSIVVAFYIAMVVYSAWSDARTLRIPNWVSLALMGAFGVAILSVGMPLEAIAWHVAAGALTLVIGFALFAFGYFGGGDAKLMAVCALWVGWQQLVFFVVAVLLVGGVLSVFVVLLRKGLGLWPDWLVQRFEGLFTPNKAVPYGIAIATGAMIVLPRMAVLPVPWRPFVNWFVG